MNRTYTVEKYMDVIDLARKKIPHITLTTDIIVGFPGETDEDYRATRDLMERVGYTMIFSFIYSPRKYTKAARLVDDCPDEVKVERLKALQARQREIGTAQNKKLVGKKLTILSQGGAFGRTEGNIRVFFNDSRASVEPNTFVFVDIVDGKLSDLTGKLCDKPVD
jgi:tRNA-2-methylthio-N6-dimethylallyladenosine synthase